MSEFRLGVVIPFVKHRFIRSLINQIIDQEVLPETVVVIDNSKDGNVPFSDLIKLKIFDFKVIRALKPLGVNESWEIGSRLCGDVDAVSILNDDIEITRIFFSRIVKVLQDREEAGAVCPNTITPKRKEIGEDRIEKMKRVEGWAFTIRKEILNAAYPMPEGMKIFAGDNWLWWHTYQGFKRVWLKHYGVNIYHHVGASQTRRTRPRLKEEREICTQHLREKFPDAYKERGAHIVEKKERSRPLSHIKRSGGLDTAAT